MSEFECQCMDAFTGRRLRKAKRHKDRISCIPQEQVEAFKEAHGLKHDGVARALIFLETFATKP